MLIPGDPDSDDKQLAIVTLLVGVMDRVALMLPTGSTSQTCTLMACSRGNRQLTWHLLTELEKRLSKPDIVELLNRVYYKTKILSYNTRKTYIK